MNQPASESVNILIVDDKADNILALELSLESVGLKIFTTTLPRNVVQICADNDISIALIDVKMPEIDGFQLLNSLKSNPITENIMVILMTGYSMSPEHVIKGLNNGAVDYLFKPLDLYITTAKVNSLVTLVNYQKEIKKKNLELEIYQEELFKAIKLTEKSKVVKENFLANMSHEIRTPLNAIIGLTHLLNDTSINDDQQEMIKLMEYSSKSLLGIVNDILESATIDSGKIQIVRSKTEIVSMVETICDLTRPMASEKGLRLNCSIDENVPTVIMADSLRLNQILINLINNAIKFTNSGSIDIHIKCVKEENGKVLLEFEIKDTGIGIPKESFNKIFTRFEQVEDKTWQKFGGNGLGLSIVKRLVELKGGHLKVESEVGIGTTFTFSNWFALGDEIKMPDSVQQRLTDLPKFDNVQILFAEDNSENQFIVVKMLEEWDIEVDVVNNGLEAFEKLKQNNYSLILMDTHMPVLNGYKAIKKIRSEMIGPKRNIPIISFSASVIEKEKNEAREAGADDFIDKPFEPKTLHDKILRLVSQAPV